MGRARAKGRRPIDAHGVEIKVSDWVLDGYGPGPGSVIRCARDGAWVDVKWRDLYLGEWSKRMHRPSALTVVATIQLPDGWTVTDMTRDDEIRAPRRADSRPDMQGRQGREGPMRAGV